MTATTEEAGEDNSGGYSTESWGRAQRYAELLGNIPSSFSTTVRTLRSNNPPGAGNEYDKSSRFLVLRLLKSETLKAPVYFAACALHPEKISPGDSVKDSDLLKMFSPHEIASVLGMIYLYRRVKRLNNSQYWDNLVSEMNRQSTIGARLGQAIPSIGSGTGVILGSVRHLALALFLAKDEKGFKVYRRTCNQKERFYDPGAEMKQWGCDHIQVASKLLQSLGFGLPLATGFSFGLSPEHAHEVDSDDDLYRWHVASVWIESLRRTGAEPSMTHRGSFYPLKETLDKLASYSREINEDQVDCSWLTREKEDLPDLSAAASKKAEAAAPEGSENPDGEGDTDIVETELPPELIEELSDDEDLDLQ